MIREQVRFIGRVQGVGFRATARSLARDLDLAGWVRNEPDGSVLMEVEGQPQTIDNLLQGIERRMGGLLERAVRSPMRPSGEIGFEIRF